MFSGPSEWSISLAKWGGSFEAVAAGAQGLSSDHPAEEDRLSRWDFFILTTAKTCVASFWCNSPFVFCLFLCSCRREHERHVRADRFSCPCHPTQLAGPQPLCRAQRPELQSGGWSHGCAGRDGSAAEGWERTVSHYHGCTVSVCRQMMSNASQPRIRGKKKKRTVDCPYNLSSVGTPMANLPHFPLAVLLCSRWDSGRAFVLWPGAQQQPSGNGLRRLRELPAPSAIDYRGWTPISYPAFALLFHPPLSSQSDWHPRRTSGLHYYECVAYVSFLADCHREFLINLPNSRRGVTVFSAGNSALCLSTFKPYTVGLQLSTDFLTGYLTDNSCFLIGQLDKI